MQAKCSWQHSWPSDKQVGSQALRQKCSLVCEALHLRSPLSADETHLGSLLVELAVRPEGAIPETPALKVRPLPCWPLLVYGFGAAHQPTVHAYTHCWLQGTLHHDHAMSWCAHASQALTPDP